MNILYLSYDGLADPLGQSQITPYLAGLAAKGYRITIISCEKPDRFAKEEISLRKLLDTCSIQWLPVTYSNSIPVVSTLFTLRRMYLAALRQNSKEPVSIIHCRSTLPAILGLMLKKKSGARLLFDMRGFWADERVEGKIWPQNNLLFRLIYNFIKKKEKQLLTLSDHIISLTNEGRNIIKKNFSISAPVTVIPCCADFAHFDRKNFSEEAILNKRSALDIPVDATVVCYAGSIGTWYMLDEMLDFFSLLQNSKPGSIFLFITRETPEVILAEAEKKGISKQYVRIVGASRNDMPLLLAISDASLYFIRPIFSKKASSPVKQGESLAMGIPVICNSGIGDSDTLIKENNLGWVIDDFNSASYQSAISNFLNSKADRNYIRQKAYGLLSLEKGIESYDEVYKQLQ